MKTLPLALTTALFATVSVVSASPIYGDDPIVKGIADSYLAYESAAQKQTISSDNLSGCLGSSSQESLRRFVGCLVDVNAVEEYGKRDETSKVITAWRAMSAGGVVPCSDNAYFDMLSTVELNASTKEIAKQFGGRDDVLVGATKGSREMHKCLMGLTAN